MDLKNAARKLWHSDVEEDQVYSGPYLVKGGHMDILVSDAVPALCAKHT